MFSQNVCGNLKLPKIWNGGSTCYYSFCQNYIESSNAKPKITRLFWLSCVSSSS